MKFKSASNATVAFGAFILFGFSNSAAINKIGDDSTKFGIANSVSISKLSNENKAESSLLYKKSPYESSISIIESLSGNDSSEIMCRRGGGRRGGGFGGCHRPHHRPYCRPQHRPHCRPHHRPYCRPHHRPH
ncbi:hypothetical protein AYI69_g8413, partial [Smittium culicis]